MDRTLESVHRPANRKRYSAVACRRGRLTAAARKEEDPWEVPVTRRENSSAPVTVDGVRACPGILGGVEWSAPAYHPPHDLLYTPAIDWCGSYFKAESFDGRRWLGGRYQGDDWDEAHGKQYIPLMSGNTSPLWPTPPAEGQVIIFGLPD